MVHLNSKYISILYVGLASVLVYCIKILPSFYLSPSEYANVAKGLYWGGVGFVLINYSFEGTLYSICGRTRRGFEAWYAPVRKLRILLYVVICLYVHWVVGSELITIFFIWISLSSFNLRGGFDYLGEQVLYDLVSLVERSITLLLVLSFLILESYPFLYAVLAIRVVNMGYQDRYLRKALNDHYVDSKIRSVDFGYKNTWKYSFAQIANFGAINATSLYFVSTSDASAVSSFYVHFQVMSAVSIILMQKIRFDLKKIYSLNAGYRTAFCIILQNVAVLYFVLGALFVAYSVTLKLPFLKNIFDGGYILDWTLLWIFSVWLLVLCASLVVTHVIVLRDLSSEYLSTQIIAFAFNIICILALHISEVSNPHLTAWVLVISSLIVMVRNVYLLLVDRFFE